MKSAMGGSEYGQSSRISKIPHILSIILRSNQRYSSRIDRGMCPY